MYLPVNSYRGSSSGQQCHSNLECSELLTQRAGTGHCSRPRSLCFYGAEQKSELACSTWRWDVLAFTGPVPGPHELGARSIFWRCLHPTHAQLWARAHAKAKSFLLLLYPKLALMGWRSEQLNKTALVDCLLDTEYEGLAHSHYQKHRILNFD